ncbi:MAG TPA: aldolase/citrate lyase family protein [Verrucomicrobiae bacterium]|nr:aldolase/citrate lyase family protein [Verrucomicrobiae bacterium]
MSQPQAPSSLRERARAGEELVGTFLSLGSPLAAEVCAQAGYDFVLVDLEHGAGGEAGLVGQLLAARCHRVPVLVRVETAARIRIGRALDLGADGVMLPRLESVREVDEATRHLRIPPGGDRGVAAYTRAGGFGRGGSALPSVHERLCCMVQIETPSAVDQAAAIARVAGVDVLFVGPNDLSHALGVPGRFDAPLYLEACATVVDAARAAGIAAGLMVPTAEEGRRARAQGFTVIAVGSDAGMLARAAAAAVATARS